MTYFIGSANVGNKVIGAANNPNSIVQNQLYPICQFPSANIARKLTFSDPVQFIQSQRNVIEFVNENGDVVFSFDTGNPPSGGNTINEIVTVEIPASEADVQTLSVRWTSRGGAFEAVFTGNIFVFEADEAVTWL